MLLSTGLATAANDEQATAAEAAAALASSLVLRLWNGLAPHAQGDTAADIPVVDVYLPAKNPTRTGILICPGGGYRYLALDHEGLDVAAWLNKRGVAAFVLNYRVAPYGAPVALLDGMRAMRLVRSRAAEFDISSDRLGVFGFSAGGHVASMLMSGFYAGLGNGEADAVDQLSGRPSFGVLAYPVISMDPAIAHPESRAILLGPHPTQTLQEQYSTELHVEADSPPAFIFATSDDPVVPIANTVRFYQAYVDRKLPVEMHLFQHGPHGVGVANGLPQLKQWTDLLASWMRVRGWMDVVDGRVQQQPESLDSERS